MRSKLFGEDDKQTKQHLKRMLAFSFCYAVCLEAAKLFHLPAGQISLQRIALLELDKFFFFKGKTMTLSFFLNSILLGVGLAMDAFSVSIANTLSEPQMKKRKMLGICTTFAGFQFLMPLLGWFCVHTLVQYFTKFEVFVPYIALILLSYIGGKTIYESVKKGKSESEEIKAITFGTLIIQGIATSIDALSVGFTIEQYAFGEAFLAALIIGAVTFGICLVGLLLGKRFAKAFSKAEIIGGIILIAIGIEIFIKGVFFS